MDIKEILKRTGMFSKDIHLRLKNGQIRLNGNIIKENIVLTHITDDMCDEDEKLFNVFVIDAGDFLFSNIVNNPLWKLQCEIFGFEELFDSNIKNSLTEFLSNYSILRISKKELLIIKK